MDIPVDQERSLTTKMSTPLVRDLSNLTDISVVNIHRIDTKFGFRTIEPLDIGTRSTTD